MTGRLRQVAWAIWIWGGLLTVATVAESALMLKVTSAFTFGLFILWCFAMGKRYPGR